MCQQMTAHIKPLDMAEPGLGEQNKARMTWEEGHHFTPPGGGALTPELGVRKFLLFQHTSFFSLKPVTFWSQLIT